MSAGFVQLITFFMFLLSFSIICRTKISFAFDPYIDDHIFFEQINRVIKNNSDAGVDVKAKIGSEMIDVLDELHYEHYLNFGKDGINDGYEQSRKLLGFTLID